MQETNENIFAPIVMFVYNRPDHFEETYRALANCPEAKQSVLYVFSDGAKSVEGETKVNEVRAALHSAERECLFREFHIIESPVNRGLAKSVIAGVSTVIEQHGSAIVVEDDCVVSPYFLRFMNRALAIYKEDKRIGSIAGFTPVFTFPDSFQEDVFLTYRSCSWGWATWRDRWVSVDWDMTYLASFCRQPELVKKFNSCGADRFLRLYRQSKGNSSSWSVRFGAHLVKNNMYTVYPRYSYVKNIGCDNSGVHSRTEEAERMFVDLDKAIPDPELTKITYDPAVQKVMKKYYSAGIVSDVKRMAAAIAIVLKYRLIG